MVFKDLDAIMMCVTNEAFVSCWNSFMMLSY
jgi:hypothetical protein